MKTDQNNPAQFNVSIKKRNAQIILNTLLISLILASVGSILMQLIQYFDQTWDGALLPLLAVLIALETQVIYRKIKETSPITSNRILFLLSEVVVLLIVIRLYLYFLRNPFQILEDIKQWDTLFLDSWFVPEYYKLLIGSLIFKLITLLLVKPTTSLTFSESILKLEKDGLIINDRTEAQKSLIKTIFTIGAVQLIIITIISSKFNLILENGKHAPKLVANLLIYFFLCFCLLAINQYYIQKSRWYLSETPVSEAVSKRWIKLSFVFLALISVAIFFLPIDHGAFLFPIVRYIINIIIFVVYLFQILIFLPISLLLSLFKTENISEPNIPDPEQVMHNFQITESPPSLNAFFTFWDSIRHIVFWIFLIILTVFSLYYFFHHLYKHQNIKTFPLLIRWFKNILNLIKSYIKNISQKTISFLSKENLIKSSFLKITGKKTNPFLLKTKLRTPRQTIIKNYIKHLDFIQTTNHSITPSHTPNENLQVLINAYKEKETTYSDLTKLFILARYTKNKISKSQEKQFMILINQINSKN